MFVMFYIGECVLLLKPCIFYVQSLLYYALLEDGTSFFSIFGFGDLALKKSIQRRFTKQLAGMNSLTYAQCNSQVWNQKN
jgi:phosphate starvation-inducible membrane PsiE